MAQADILNQGYPKIVGRFKGQIFDGCTGRIIQTHANGSDEEVGQFIHMDLNNLQDLQYLISRMISGLEIVDEN